MKVTKGVKDMKKSMIVLALLLTACGTFAFHARAQNAALATPELVRVWDAEHVSPPVSPLVDHAEVMTRIEALKAGADRARL